MCSVYEDAEQLDEEIDLVARMMVDAAERQLPLVQPKDRGGGGMIHSVACVLRAELSV